MTTAAELTFSHCFVKETSRWSDHRFATVINRKLVIFWIMSFFSKSLKIKRFQRLIKQRQATTNKCGTESKPIFLETQYITFSVQ